MKDRRGERAIQSTAAHTAPMALGAGSVRVSDDGLAIGALLLGNQLLKAANPTLRAAILLGINAGFGNTDCSALPIASVDLETSVIDFERPSKSLPSPLGAPSMYVQPGHDSAPTGRPAKQSYQRRPRSGRPEPAQVPPSAFPRVIHSPTRLPPASQPDPPPACLMIPYTVGRPSPVRWVAASG